MNLPSIILGMAIGILLVGLLTNIETEDIRHRCQINHQVNFCDVNTVAIPMVEKND